MADRVDDHRVLVDRSGTLQDITPLVGDLTATDDLETLAVEVGFTLLVSPWDRYVPTGVLAPGSKLHIRNHGVDVWSGVVVTVGLDGSVIAYDRGWYLGKSQVVLQAQDAPAADVVRRACALAGIPAGSIDLPAQTITQIWAGDTPSDIISDVLDACSAATGKTYHSFVQDGALQVETLGVTPITAYHRPAENVAAFDITWALGQVSGEDSIQNMVNAVKIVAGDDQTTHIGAEASNAASIARYGYLQMVESVSEDPGAAQLEAMVRSLLAQRDRVAATRTVGEIWGSDTVKSGVVLRFNSPAFGIEGLHRVTRVVHRYGGAGHTMELELAALSQPRAAPQAADTVQVYGFPAGIGASDAQSVEADSSAGSRTAGTAAAFVQAAAGEVGYREGPGNQNKYGAWAGNNGVAWCAYFVCWCGAQVDAPIPTNIGSVSGLRDWFSARGKYHTVASGYSPKTGDIMIQKTSASHTGIVESASGNRVQTIEGNCSNMVRRMTRSLSEIDGFCSPWDEGG